MGVPCHTISNGETLVRLTDENFLYQVYSVHSVYVQRNAMSVALSGTDASGVLI